MRGSREWAVGPDPAENHKNIGFLSNTHPDPLKITSAFKPGIKGWGGANAIFLFFTSFLIFRARFMLVI